MIFDKLFLQYQKGKRATFGSKFMDKHGRFFLGTPADCGLGDTREDLQLTYYHIAPDRIPPTHDKVAMDQWSTESILYAQFRNSNAPEVSRGTTYVGLSVVLLFVILGAGIRITSSGTNKLKDWCQTKEWCLSKEKSGQGDESGQAMTGGAVEARESDVVVQCRDFIERVNSNQIILSPSIETKIDRCAQIIKEAK